MLVQFTCATASVRQLVTTGLGWEKVSSMTVCGCYAFVFGLGMNVPHVE